jgi:asparagine synthase (glutamine-hydrolysing)
LLQRLVNENAVEKLGFVKWREVEKLWSAAFVQDQEEDLGKKTWAWRQLIMIAQWVVLGEKFRVKTARISHARHA